MLKVKDLRDSFIQFFKERDHRIVASSSLIPKDDPTLLFTTAGMVQFKPMFAGSVKLDYTRAATIQKCLRTSDLENVGKTERHCTFFEMLGNFSFGDYFKKQAIEYAWDYSTEVINFPPEDIWISIYRDDEEAFDIWKRIGIPKDRIVRLGKADNFWGPAGDSGACGPCSELYIDRGSKYGCSSENCRPGCDCGRFLEYWNLVFNQFFQDKEGNLTPLPQTGIDTGMGLERLATLVQGVDSIFETDELKKIVNFVCREMDVEYNGENISPINVLAEHSRALTFAISDGVYPSNEGRGYVLRRILRRALRYGRQIGICEPFLNRMVDVNVDIMGDYYPEIKRAAKNIKSVLEGEERRFLETLESGMNRLNELLETVSLSNKKRISGKDAFILYDTYGFPLEMTVEIAMDKNLEVDTDAYQREMEKQKDRGKQSWKGKDFKYEKIVESLTKEIDGVVFKGYDENVAESDILLLSSGDSISGRIRTSDKGIIVTAETTFYGEAGGQTGDKGRIISTDGAIFKVDGTKRFNKIIIHIGEVIDGEFKIGSRVKTEIDVLRRNLIRANHTATHLLQAALRSTIGDHVHQAGSLVEPEKLRFDFTHFKALSIDEIEKIEHTVNKKIWEAQPVQTEIMPLRDAMATGALAVFDEKYDEIARVVKVEDYSMELCGGTHVDNTGKIGAFKILKEASPGSGVRRIEAITLKGFFDKFNKQSQILSDIGRELNIHEDVFIKKIKYMVERLDDLEKEIKKRKKEKLTLNVDSIIANAVIINSTKVIIHQFDEADINELRRISDIIRSRESDSLICFGSKNDNKALLLFAATKRAVEKGADCGKMISDISKIIGGRGGGRKDMAQAGGKTPGTIGKALKEAIETARSMIAE